MSTAPAPPQAPLRPPPRPPPPTTPQTPTPQQRQQGRRERRRRRSSSASGPSTSARCSTRRSGPSPSSTTSPSSQVPLLVPHTCAPGAPRVRLGSHVRSGTPQVHLCSQVHPGCTRPLTPPYSLSPPSLSLPRPGHVLVLPKRVVPRYADLTTDETCDLWLTAQRIGRIIEGHFEASSLTFTIQVHCSPTVFSSNLSVYCASA